MRIFFAACSVLLTGLWLGRAIAALRDDTESESLLFHTVVLAIMIFLTIAGFKREAKPFADELPQPRSLSESLALPGRPY